MLFRFYKDPKLVTKGFYKTKTAKIDQLKNFKVFINSN